MQVIAVAGRKGGVGKTTTAVHLAGTLAERGRKVVLIDADTQGSAAHWAAPGILPMPVKKLPVQSDTVGEWVRTIRGLKADIVVVDLPPHLDAAFGAALGLSDLVLLPCGPSGIDLMVMGEVLAYVKQVRARRGGKPPVIFVPNRIDRRIAEGREIIDQLEKLGEAVSPILADRVAFVRAFNSGDIVRDADVSAFVDFVERDNG